MQVEIVGVKKSEYKGKDGKMKVGFNYSGVKPYTTYEKENADCVGVDVVKEFSSIDFGVKPGDIVEFLYEPGYKDMATLVDVRMLKMADAASPDQVKEDNPYDGDDVVHGMDTKDKPKEKAAAK